MPHTLGLHHVTAITAHASRNVDFYSRILGLRLVKRTVNFGDPKSYHLYFGDERGTPGTLMTFFVWPDAAPGAVGSGQVGVTRFSVEPTALAFWIERLLRHGIPFTGPTKRTLGGATESALAFRDPDGLHLELVGAAEPIRVGWNGGAEIPDAARIRGLHSVAVWVVEGARTEALLVETLGFAPVGRDGSTARFSIGAAGAGHLIDVRTIGGFGEGVEGPGTVHHVAWAVADDPAQEQVREILIAAGLTPTKVYDRKYFRSVYAREPGNVLYEFATNGPGFTVDQPVAELGDRLMLPPQLESRRAELEGTLPSIERADPDSPSAFLAQPEPGSEDPR